MMNYILRSVVFNEVLKINYKYSDMFIVNNVNCYRCCLC